MALLSERRPPVTVVLYTQDTEESGKYIVPYDDPVRQDVIFNRPEKRKKPVLLP